MADQNEYGRSWMLDDTLDTLSHKSWDDLVAEAQKTIDRLRKRGVKFEVEWHERGDFVVDRVCTLTFSVDEDEAP